MAQRQKSSPVDGLFELLVLLPWWGGVAIAPIAFLVLHGIAGQQVTVAGSPGQIGSAITATLLKSLASVGQYVLPVVCLAVALGSALGRRKRQALLTYVASGGPTNALDGMTWREFEMLVGEAFRSQGYQVVETGGSGADGGVDLVLRKERETFLVQCKQWKAFKVGVTVVRELFGVMAARGAAGGFVVTSGRFTKEASGFASGRNLELIDGVALIGLIRQAKSVRTGTEPKADVPLTSAAAASASATPACPICGSGMFRRTAKRGANAGGDFWGCQTFPTCRGVRSIA